MNNLVTIWQRTFDRTIHPKSPGTQALKVACSDTVERETLSEVIQIHVKAVHPNGPTYTTQFKWVASYQTIGIPPVKGKFLSVRLGKV